MHLLALALALVASLLAPITAAQAQAYPSAPITLILPFAAGSGTDAIARLLAKPLGARLRQPVLVENRPGASGQIAAQAVAAARPDGYTLMMTTNTAHSANPSLFRRLRYDPIKDFTPITRTGELPLAVVVKPDLPVRTLADFIALARANPGQLSYATPNSASLVASETIKRMAGIDILGVPYRSSPQALTELIGGDIDMYVVDLVSGGAMIRAGKVRVLATTNIEGSKNLPGVPPVAQTLKDFDVTSWNGIVGPAGLPRAIVDRLNTEILAVLADREVQDSLLRLGFEVWPTKSPEEFGRYLVEQLRHWAELIDEAGLEAE